MLKVSDELTAQSRTLIEQMIKTQVSAMEENIQRHIDERFDKLAK